MVSTENLKQHELNVYEMVSSCGGRAKFIELLKARQLDQTSPVNQRGLRSRDYLVTYHMKLVYLVLNRSPYRDSNYDELVSTGMAGLLRAVELFNPHKGFKFSTLATMIIKIEMSLAGRNNQLIKLSNYALTRLNKAKKLMSSDYNVAEFNAVCDSLGYTAKLTESLAQHLHPVVSLDALLAATEN